ncbi:hypothetical protein FOZ60_017020, partial [Perkinsus olseni]
MVRAAGDMNLMRVLSLLRQATLTDDDQTELRALITSNCTFAASLADVPVDQNIIRVFAKRAPERREVARLSQLIQSDNSIQCCRHEAVDEVTSSLGGGAVWRVPTNAEVHQLNAELQEPRELTLYHGCIVRFTRNDSNRAYTNGQLAYVGHAALPVRVFIAPSGNRQIPSETVIVSQWEPYTVRPLWTPTCALKRGGYGRRLQLPLRVYVSTTVHKCLGSTMAGVACKLSVAETPYRFWEKAQLYVLLSRVKRLQDVTLVGPLEDVMNAVAEVSTRRGQYDAYLYHMLHVLGDTSTMPLAQPLDMSLLPYRPVDLELPDASTGFVYWLMSLRT